MLHRRRVRLVFKAKGTLNVIVWRFKLKAVNSLVLFAIIGQDEIFQRNLYDRKDRKKKNYLQGEETITEQRIKNGHRERQWTSQLQ